VKKLNVFKPHHTHHTHHTHNITQHHTTPNNTHHTAPHTRVTASQAFSFEIFIFFVTSKKKIFCDTKKTFLFIFNRGTFFSFLKKKQTANVVV